MVMNFKEMVYDYHRFLEYLIMSRFFQQLPSWNPHLFSHIIPLSNKFFTLENIFSPHMRHDLIFFATGSKRFLNIYKAILIIVIHSRISQKVSAEVNDAAAQCAQKELTQKPYLIDRFSMQQLVADCRMQMEWAERAKNAPAKFSDDTVTSSQRDWLNRLRSCQGAQCLTDVIKCASKRCRSKPLGAAWTGFVQSRRNTPMRSGGPSFADFGLRADNLDTVNLSTIGDQFFLNEDDHLATCQKREKVAQMCHVILKAENVSQALQAIEENYNKTRPKFIHDFEKTIYQNFKTKCRTLVDNLAQRNLTLYHVKPCPDGTEPPGTKNGTTVQSMVDYCFKVLRARTPGDAFPEQFQNAKDDELKIGRLLARYGQWLERCRKFKDLLVQNNASLEKMTTLKYTREPYSAKNPPMQRRFWADKNHPKATSAAPKSRKKRQVVSSLTTVVAATAAPISTIEQLNENRLLRSAISDLFADAPSSPRIKNDQRAMRKEYRMMTDEERRRYHAAVNRPKTEKIDGYSKYELFILHHSPEEAPEAHFSAAFLPYHRELLKQFEVALRSLDATVSVPYWDSRMDHDLPDPRDSIVWTEEFFGNGQGYVTTGPYAHWLTTHAYKNQFVRLYRETGQSMQGTLFNESFIREAITSARYDDLVYCVKPDFELSHGGVHMWVGGHMFNPPVSPNDPVFFSHHAFLDLVFEEFRQTRQRPNERQTYNGALSCPATRGTDMASLPMSPFRPLRNVDGMSNRYEELYRYQPRPVCSRTAPTCSSPYLFCDVRSGYRCVSKIRPGGNCKGFEGTNICYEGVCPAFSICPRSATPIKQPQPQTHAPLVPDRKTTKHLVPIIGSTLNPGPWMNKNREPLADVERVQERSPQKWERPSATTVRSMPQNKNPWWINQQQQNSRNDPSWNMQGVRSFPNRTGFQNPNWPSANVWQNQNQISQIFFTCTITRSDGSSLDTAGIEISSFRGERSLGFLVPGTGLYPAYKGGAVLSARDPDTTQGRVNVVTVEVRDRYGKNCQAKCYEPRSRRYATCRGQFRLSNDRRSADPIQMSGTQREALEGMWVRNGNNMYRLPDYCRFECI